MKLSDWPAYPHQVDALVRRWREAHPGLISVEALPQYTRHRVYALTVSDGPDDQQDKRGLICAVPHAHEPAATVGILDFVNELLTGQHLDRRPSELDRERILRRCLLTFIPDANPGGRARSPQPYWDGRSLSNNDFLDVAFGIDARTEGRFKRVARWSMLEDVPARLGIVYEQVSEHEYVEPNRDEGSSLVRLSRAMQARHRYHCQVHLHQTEFDWQGKDPTNCMAILPALQDELPEGLQRQNLALAGRMIEAWREVGGHPLPEPRPFGYGEPARGWFVRCWGEVQRRMPDVLVEVQNNNRNTAPVQQMALCSAGIRAAVGWLVVGAEER
ncbi:MAG: hypothetical protein HPY83_10040 [Anaerolineae bacterium]|nr:hypothetical protein [Anaerolineae bacterium]